MNRIEDLLKNHSETPSEEVWKRLNARLDAEMPVVADTTAMSTPHEISYTLYFDSSSLPERNAEHTSGLYAGIGYGIGAAVGIGVLAGLIIYGKGRKKDA